MRTLQRLILNNYRRRKNMSKHYSTKHYGHNIGLSAVLRQSKRRSFSAVIRYMDSPVFIPYPVVTN